MPQGKGTYGSQVGRPSKENKSEYDVYDASKRKQNVQGYQEGGGTPEPQEYGWGGLARALKKAVTPPKAVKKRLVKAMTRPSQWREWKPFEQRGFGLGKLAAGAGQALTHTDEAMYDQLSEFEGQSLGDFATDYPFSDEGSGDKTIDDVVKPLPTRPQNIWGYKKGGKVKKK